MAVKWNRAIWSNVRNEVRKQIAIETEAVKTEAISLIFDTPKTGRVYTRGSIVHQASAPGEPFANDTGNAVAHITTRFEDDYLTGIVNAGAEYAAFLELGTAKMAPRPVFRPALANREKDIRKNIAKAVRRGINISG